MKKTIKRNLYAVSDVMAVITLLLLVVFIAKKDETLFKCFFGGIFLTIFFTIVQMFMGKSKVENESILTVYTKSEEGCDAVELNPGSERYDVDGVKSNGVVYKLSDGVHGVIQENGTLRVKSFTAKFINSVIGGVISSAPDSCWEPLIKAPMSDSTKE